MQTTWVIKASKLCNMRCSYCYEWDELDHKDRISIELWRQILVAIRDLRALQRTVDPAASADIILHGGEPLILPVAYLREVARLNAEILGVGGDAVGMGVQTNALAVSDAMLAFLAEAGIRVGVSHDVVSGVRRSMALEPVERRVEANLEKLQRAGLCRAGIVVLASHTVPQLREVYEWYADRGLSLRILPLFDGPESRPSGFALSNDEIAAAMCDLFDHWITTGARVPLEPFPELLGYVATKILGIRLRAFDRGIDGERLLLVNTNGDLYHVPEAYGPGMVLGNLGTDLLEDILARESYWESIQRARDRFTHYCGECEYAASCGGLPLQQLFSSGPHSGRCPVIHNVLVYMERFLLEGGFGRNELGHLLIASQQQHAAMPAV